MLQQAALRFEDSDVTDAERLISAVNRMHAALGEEPDEETDKRCWDCVTAQCGTQFLEDKVNPEASLCGCGIHKWLPVRQDRPHHMAGEVTRKQCSQSLASGRSCSRVLVLLSKRGTASGCPGLMSLQTSAHVHTEF